MTSLRLSRFSRTPRRALYLTGRQVTAYEWRRGRLQEAFLFHLGEEGLAEFATYLAEAPWIPVYLLVDVVEEEFRRDTLPHVMGRDRRAMVRTRFSRLFRDTPYSSVQFQGRETQGRRDDKVLFSALTSPGLLSPWLDRLHEARVPVAGIYSLPILSQALVPIIAEGAKQVLIMTLQSMGNLRQSFYVDGHLKISRLAHMPTREPAMVVDAMMDEAEKLRRYLNSLRLLARDEPLYIYMASHGTLLDALSSVCRDDVEGMRCQVVELADVAVRLRMDPAFVSPYADALFAHLLLTKPPANHYGTSRDTRYNTLRRARLGMLAASMILALGSIAWGGLEVVNGLVYKQRSDATRQQAFYYQQRYLEARRGLPELPAEPQDVQKVVEATEALAASRTAPKHAMELVSVALDPYPSLRVERMRWALGPGEGEKPKDPRAAARAAIYGDGAPKGDAHVTIDGRLDPFDGDYRLALETLKGFAESLRTVPGILEVKLVSLPLNLSPNQQLRGNATVEKKTGTAQFQIKVVFGVDDGQA